MARTLLAYGINAAGALCWEVGGRMYDITNQHGLQEAIAQQAKDRLWGRIAAKRTAYQGMAQGRDDIATMCWRNNIQEERTQAFLDIILTDGVYTPLRAHLRWAKDPRCPLLPSRGS